MQPLEVGKTKAYTFLLPILYYDKVAKQITNNFKDVDNVYIDEEYNMHCVNKAKKAIYSLKFQRKYISQYNLYLEGKYSKFSPHFKSLILKFWLGDTTLKSILFRGQLIKDYWSNKGYVLHTWSEEDSEYWPKPFLKNEYL
jgi:hypothetical protein